jgi:hypothetical protein
VASFSGGAVGVISALMVVEINNVKQQELKRCKYCLGTGTFSSKTFSCSYTMKLGSIEDGICHSVFAAIQPSVNIIYVGLKLTLKSDICCEVRCLLSFSAVIRC